MGDRSMECLGVCMHGGRSDIIAHDRSRAFSCYHKRALSDIDPAGFLFFSALSLSLSLFMSNWGTQSTRHHGNWRTETHLIVLSGIWTGTITISVIMRSHYAWNICILLHPLWLKALRELNIILGLKTQNDVLLRWLVSSAGDVCQPLTHTDLCTKLWCKSYAKKINCSQTLIWT